jgi:branched-chain amino acid transport system substrate-binding protein
MRLINLLVSFCLLLLFSACKKEGPKQEITTYPVVGLFSLTGNWSSLGVTSEAVMELAVEDINNYLEERGSSVRFSSTVYDTKLDTNLAKSFFQAAVKDLNAKFVLGPQSSAEVGSIRNMANDEKVLVMSQGSTASSLAFPNDAVFRFCPGDGPEGAAISRTAFQSGKRMMITLARNDAGNLGLQSSVNTNFTALGGQVDALSPYSSSLTDFTAVAQQLRAKIQQHVATFGSGAVGVYLASFDECVNLFRQALVDPVLRSVNWYGGDGVVLSAPLLADVDARQFAATVNFFAPNFGLPAQAHPNLASVEAAVRSRTGLDPDAYALSVYDAMWVLANTAADFPITLTDFSALKYRFSEEANRFFGISGPVMLNINGDRAIGSFDYWGIVNEAGNYRWKIVGKSN